MPPGRDVDPPSRRLSRRPRMAGGNPYGWIAEPTAELVDLLDAERAYYEARVAPLAELRATLAAEMAARVPASSESAPWRSGDFTYREIHGAGAEFPTLVRAQRRRPGRVRHRPAGGRRRQPRRGVSPRRVRGQPRRHDVGLVIRRRRRRAVPPSVPRPGHRHGPAGHHRVDISHRRVERGLDDVSISAHRRRQSTASGVGACARHRSRDGSHWSSPNQTSGSKSASTSPARVRGSSITASSRNTSEVHVLSCAEPGGRPTLVRARQDRRRVLRRARARSRRRSLPHRHESRRRVVPHRHRIRRCPFAMA